METEGMEHKPPRFPPKPLKVEAMAAPADELMGARWARRGNHPSGGCGSCGAGAGSGAQSWLTHVAKLKAKWRRKQKVTVEIP